ncbi:uncharacterized protein LOC114643066 [Erpetoichthys calabaricus]|uniref:uncharacterized protein LOC114643066 n=1 Tax=Erpetoichthys calabaricus TaxID=27687 RepID=UPI00223440A9|nr:uncharacterized protein LOC114643066 [Erpetoichthys calabaricus]
MKSLLSLFPLLLAVECTLQVSTPSSQVTGLRHTDVLLPCTFTDEPIDLKYLLVIWKHDSMELARYESKKTNMKSMVELSEDELPRGNASLLIKKVSIRDEGEYRCEVIHSPDSGKAVLNLRVLAPPEVDCKPTLVTPGKENSLECTAKGFYPKEIVFSWWDGAQSPVTSNPTNVKSNVDGSFNATSYHSFTPLSSDTNANISCEVAHEALGSLVVVPVRVAFRRRATVTVSPQTLVRGKEQTLTCKVYGYYPDSVEVTWLKNGEPYRKPVTPGNLTTEEHHSVTVTDNKDGFSCQVEQEGFESRTMELEYNLIDEHISVKTIVSIAVPLLLAIALLIGLLVFWLQRKSQRVYISEIFAPTKIFVGEQVTLECLFSGRQPKVQEPAWLVKYKGQEWVKIKGWQSEGYTISTVFSQSTYVMKNSVRGEWQPLVSVGNKKENSTLLQFVADIAKHGDAVFKCEITCVHRMSRTTIKQEKEIQIYAFPSVSSIKDVSVHGEKEGTLLVVATNFYPKDIKFVWPVYNLSSTEEATQNEDGLYSCHSICKASWEDLQNPNFILQVEIIHGSQEPVYKTLCCGTPGIGGIPDVSSIKMNTPLEIGRPCTLSCMVTDFYLRPSRIAWVQKNISSGQEIVSGEDNYWNPTIFLYGPYKKYNSIYYMEAQAEFTPSTANIEDMDFICRVEHSLLREAVEQRTGRLSAAHRPTVSGLIPMPPLMISHPYVLTCEVTDFYPKDMKVTWLVMEKEKKPVVIQEDTFPNITVSAHPPYRSTNNLYSLVTQVEFMPQKVDLHRSTMIVRVEHKTLNEYIERQFNFKDKDLSGIQCHYDRLIRQRLSSGAAQVMWT